MSKVVVITLTMDGTDREINEVLFEALHFSKYAKKFHKPSYEIYSIKK